VPGSGLGHKAGGSPLIAGMDRVRIEVSLNPTKFGPLRPYFGYQGEEANPAFEGIFPYPILYSVNVFSMKATHYHDVVVSCASRACGSPLACHGRS